MAHIVFIIGGLTSLRNAVVEIAARLHETGHEITIASPKQIGPAIQAQQLPYVQLEPLSPYRDAGSYLQKWARRRQRLDAEVAAWGLEDTLTTLRAMQPDLIVIETELPEYVIALSQLGVPLATIAYFASLYKRPTVPPLHMRIMPGAGWRGTRLGIEAAWLHYRLQLLRREARHLLRHSGLYRIAALRHYAQRVGFNFRQNASTDQWLIPLTFEGVPLLYPVALEFDFPHEPPAHVHHLGALLSDRKSGTTQFNPQDEEQARLQAILTEHEAAGDEQKLLYCAFGATFKGDDTPFIKRVIAAVANQPTWTMILSLGGRRTVDALGPLPDNVLAFNWVPQLAVLAQADVAIVHAGMATCMECIHYGVPMLSYPFTVNDQIGNAMRIAYYRLGIVGDRDQDEASTIQQHIQRLLTEDDFQARLATMQAAFQRYTPAHTVHIFGELLAQEKK